MKTRGEQLAEFERLLSDWDGKIARAFLEGIRVVQSELKLAQIERALRENSPNNAIDILARAVRDAGFLSFSRTLTDAMIAGGDYAARIASANRIEFGFGVTESNTARFMEQYRAGKIVQINREMRDVISQIVFRNAGSGVNPVDTARAVRANIGLTAYQEGHVANYRRFLEELPKRRAAESALNEYTLRDKRFDRSMIRAIEESKPLPKAQLDKMEAAYRRRYLIRRSENIARTESQTMLQTGQKEYWRQMTDAGIALETEIKRKWIVTRDSRLRHSHAQIPALNPDGVGLEEPFKSPLGLIRYPGDPNASAANRINCRCHVFVRIDRE